MSFRRKLLNSVSKKNKYLPDVPSGALICLRCKGDLKDTSPYGRVVDYTDGVVINDDYVTVSAGQYIKSSNISSSYGTISASFWYEGKLSERCHLWGVQNTWSSNWPVYTLMARLSRSGDSHCMSICTYGNVIDIYNDYLIEDSINNVTVTKNSSYVKVYINGSLVETVSTSDNGSPSYDLFIGNSNKVGSIASEGSIDIYGFAKYSSVLSASNVKILSDALSYVPY